MTTQLRILLLILFVLSINCQLPEDDEVDTSIPGYTHAIYSGTSLMILRLSRYYHWHQSQIDSLCLFLITKRFCERSTYSLVNGRSWLFEPYQHDSRKWPLPDCPWY